MRYLFWNTNKKDVATYIIELINKYNPSIIALAEYEFDVSQLLEEIKIKCNDNYCALTQLACRVKIIVRLELEEYIEHCNDNNYYTIKAIPYNNYIENHIVAFVHLPSKMHLNDEKNRYLLEKLTIEINELNKDQNRKVLILGDFNLNPYENPMTYITGCSAVSSTHVAERISKKFNKNIFFYYYNPMWSFLGDFNGTYYYDKLDMDTKYWNTFDQFIVSPKLIKDIKKIEIIRNVEGIRLCNEVGIPTVSDHFPIYMEMGGV